MVWALALGLLLLLGSVVHESGNDLRRRHAFKFCVAAAIISLILGPLGMIAGIYTLVQLNDESVRKSFRS